MTEQLFTAIRDALLKQNNGIDVAIEGGGSGATFLAVTLSPAAQVNAAKDTRVAVYANQNETWQADMYESLDAIYNGEPALNSEDYATSIDSDVTDANRIARAFLSLMNDVCITGNPAWFGRCDDADCICHPNTTPTAWDWSVDEHPDHGIMVHLGTRTAQLVADALAIIEPTGDEGERVAEQLAAAITKTLAEQEEANG